MKSRSRKRMLLMVLLLLAYIAGGAIINVAVAWGCFRSHDSGNPYLSFGWTDVYAPLAPGQENRFLTYPSPVAVLVGWPQRYAQIRPAVYGGTARCEDVKSIGFAINTIFYAAILWLLFAAPGFVRRRFVIRGRIKRGQCPACAYPVGSSDVCTECGTAGASLLKSQVSSAVNT